MTTANIVKQLKSLGTDGYRKILLKHGVSEPVFGVKIEELKRIQKVVKQDYRLALELYDTGIYDAMYLAGLIADDEAMTKKDLTHWVATAPCEQISEFTVAWVAAESMYGHDLALEWIDSKKARIAASGWATLTGLVAITPDADLDLAELRRLLARVQKTIHAQPDRVRATMNLFVIAVGSYVLPLTDKAIASGIAIGPVSVDVGDTACKVPFASEQIEKVRQRGSLGKKRKTTKC